MSTPTKAASTRSARAWRKASRAEPRRRNTSPRGSRARARTSFRFWRVVRRLRRVHPPRSGGGGGARGAPGGGKVTAFGGREPRAEGTAALKAEPEQKLSPAEQLEQHQLAVARGEVADARASARAMAAEKRAEAKAKGYEGE